MFTCPKWWEDLQPLGCYLGIVSSRKFLLKSRWPLEMPFSKSVSQLSFTDSNPTKLWCYICNLPTVICELRLLPIVSNRGCFSLSISKRGLKYCVPNRGKYFLYTLWFDLELCIYFLLKGGTFAFYWNRQTRSTHGITATKMCFYVTRSIIVHPCLSTWLSSMKKTIWNISIMYIFIMIYWCFFGEFILM